MGQGDGTKQGDPRGTGVVREGLSEEVSPKRALRDHRRRRRWGRGGGPGGGREEEETKAHLEEQPEQGAGSDERGAAGLGRDPRPEEGEWWSRGQHYREAG